MAKINKMTDNYITHNFAIWIIMTMFDELGRELLKSGDGEKHRRLAKVFYRRIERQLFPHMTDEDKQYVKESCSFEFDYIKMIATCENVYDVI